MRQLIFIHGRAQEDKNAKTLKKEWIAAWEKGLMKSGLSNPLPDSQIRFPYYGDTLRDLVAGMTAAQAARVIVMGPAPGGPEEDFARAMIEQLAKKAGVSKAQIRAELSAEVIEKGPANWGWVQGILRAVDKVKPLSGKLVSLITKDVYKYLHQTNVSTPIDTGVRGAPIAGNEAVVVSHSLGTVVAYNVLMERGGILFGCKVPLFVTLGSPLAVTVIENKLRPHTFPKNVGAWYNAMDPNDVVSLYPLTPKHFNVGKPIENHTKVKNWTDNQHSIDGYLDDQEVAKKIHDALVA